jgi:hypothetical protein
MDEIAERVILTNMGLISLFVQRYAVRESDVADMVQEARLTIWQHFCRWDPDRMSLSAFVTQGLQHDVRKLQGRLQGRGSYRQILGRSQVLSCEAELAEKLGRSPSDDEIAIELSMDPTRVHNLRRRDERYLSDPIGEDLTLGDTIFLESAHVSQADEDAEYGIWLAALRAATEHLEIGVTGLTDGPPRSFLSWPHTSALVERYYVGVRHELASPSRIADWPCLNVSKRRPPFSGAFFFAYDGFVTTLLHEPFGTSLRVRTG